MNRYLERDGTPLEGQLLQNEADIALEEAKSAIDGGTFAKLAADKLYRESLVFDSQLLIVLERLLDHLQCRPVDPPVKPKFLNSSEFVCIWQKHHDDFVEWTQQLHQLQKLKAAFYEQQAKGHPVLEWQLRDLLHENHLLRKEKESQAITVAKLAAENQLLVKQLSDQDPDDSETDF